MNVKRYLTEGEWELYDNIMRNEKDLGSASFFLVAGKALESLAACRALLEEAGECLAPGSDELHERIATALQGVGGE